MSRDTDHTDGRSDKPSLEGQWIDRLRLGDEKAFEKLYRLYFPKLSQFVFRYVNSRYIAEDLVQNVFFSLWRNREELEPVDTLRPYLYRAARNQAFRHINRSDDEMITDLPLTTIPGKSSWNPDEITDDGKLEQAVIEAVKQLPDKRRQIYLMHREDGLTYREIAQVLDISVKTVETQMSRSLKFLRNYLSDLLSVISMLLPLVR